VSVFGPKRLFLPSRSMSAFGGKADIVVDLAECLLMTQSGHQVTFAQPNGPNVHFDQTATVVAIVVAIP
jgi:hypothetical protein